MERYFDGADYQHDRDYSRLNGQIWDVFLTMKDGQWRTLQEIHDETGHPHASISAQLRHLRKERFGGYAIERQYISKGLYKYRLDLKVDAHQKPKMPKKPDNDAAYQMCQMLYDAMRLQSDGGAVISLTPLDLSLVERLSIIAGVKK